MPMPLICRPVAKCILILTKSYHPFAMYSCLPSKAFLLGGSFIFMGRDCCHMIDADFLHFQEFNITGNDFNLKHFAM